MCDGDTTSPGPADPRPEERSQTSSSDEKLRRLRSRPSLTQERYQFRDEIGRGGMGAVLRVRDLDLQRNLAMKVILGQAGESPSGDTPPVDPEVLQRFLDEAQITSQLDHPGVVPVHELGVDDKQRIYFTMRLVKGDTADQVFAQACAGEGGWTQTRALEVILKVCDTMAFAHKKRVLHRDLKPSNVMVGKFGEVYVMDWGLAKVIGEKDRRDLRIRPESTVSRVGTDRSSDEADSDSPILTMDGAIAGTPSYMSPEQAEGRVEVMDHRADVYSVGAMLYQLLTGRQPYVNPGARVSPRTILLAVQQGPPAKIHELEKTIPAELVAVCEKAMARRPADRYPDMGALSDDLRAFLEGRVVMAYRTGPAAELVTWVRRNRALAVAAGLFVLALLGGLTAAARLTREQARLLTEASWTAFNQADRLFGEAGPASAATGDGAANDGLLQLVRAVSFDASNKAAWERLANEIVMRKAAWRLPGELRTFTHAKRVNTALFSPDGARVLTASDDNTAEVWEVDTGRRLQSFSHQAEVTSAVFSPDGTQVLTLGERNAATLWEGTNGTRLKSFAHDDGVSTAVFSPDGGRVLTSSFDGTAALWDAGSGVRLRTFSHDRPIQSAEFNADGTRVVTASLDHTAVIWDTEKGARLLTLQDDEIVDSARFSPDGTLILTSSDNKTAKVWDAKSGTRLHTLAHEGDVSSAVFSPDGTRVLTASFDGTAKVWDANSGAWLQTLRHRGAVAHAVFSPDGTRILTAGDGTTAKVWDAASGARLQTLAHTSWVRWAAFGPGGTRVLTASYDNTAKLWETGIGSCLQILPHRGDVYSSMFSPDGTRVVTASRDGTARLWDAKSGALERTLAHESVIAAAFCPDGMRLVTAGYGFKLWDISGNLLIHRDAYDSPLAWAKLSPDGARVLTASWGSRAVLVDIAKGGGLEFVHGALVGCGAFSSDSARVLTASWDTTAKLWDTGSGACLRTLMHGSHVNTAVFSPDNTRVLTASNDRTVKLWDANNGLLLQSFVHEDEVAAAVFVPGGERVLTTIDREATLWDTRTGAPLQTFGCRVLGQSAAVDQDGNRVMLFGMGNTTLCDADTGARVQSLWDDRNGHHAVLSPDGARVAMVAQDTAKLWDVSLGRFFASVAQANEVRVAREVVELLTQRQLSSLSTSGGMQTKQTLARPSTWPDSLVSDLAFAPLVEWLLARGPNAPAFPGATVTCRQQAEMLIADGTSAGVHEAGRLDPGHPLLQIALAAHETDDNEVSRTRRDFLRDYGLKHLPSDAEICARAAQMLLQQTDNLRALRAADLSLMVDPTNAIALRVREKIRR